LGTWYVITVFTRCNHALWKINYFVSVVELWTWYGWQIGNELKTERDVIMYRAYVAQRKFGVVLSEVKTSSPAELQSVRMFADYLANESRRYACSVDSVGDYTPIKRSSADAEGLCDVPQKHKYEKLLISQNLNRPRDCDHAHFEHYVIPMLIEPTSHGQPAYKIWSFIHSIDFLGGIKI